MISLVGYVSARLQPIITYNDAFRRGYIREKFEELVNGSISLTSTSHASEGTNLPVFADGDVRVLI
jgi:hypothetical protein